MELVTAQEKRARVDEDHPTLSIRRQCELLDLHRSNWYYEPRKVDPYNLKLMNLIDEEYTRHPFYGAPRLTVYLKRQGHEVNHKRVERLMKEMGIMGICPKKNLSQATAGHLIYPYLLRDRPITGPNQVWASDITYIRLAQGFIYLVAIMDWYSRYVLTWEISNTLTADFCVDALENAFMNTERPDIFNTDQGSQFTSETFTTTLIKQGIKISMDSKGRAFDNIFIERLWRSVKYEEVYIKQYRSVLEAKTELRNYFEFYNHDRPHQSLNYKTPAEVYFGSKKLTEVKISSVKQRESEVTDGQEVNNLIMKPTTSLHPMTSHPQKQR